MISNAYVFVWHKYSWVSNLMLHELPLPAPTKTSTILQCEDCLVWSEWIDSGMSSKMTEQELHLLTRSWTTPGAFSRAQLKPDTWKASLFLRLPLRLTKYALLLNIKIQFACFHLMCVEASTACVLITLHQGGTGTCLTFSVCWGCPVWLMGLHLGRLQCQCVRCKCDSATNNQWVPFCL